MDLSSHYWNFATPADPARIARTLADSAHIAEQAGFAGFTVMDQFFQREQQAPADERIRRSVLVTGPPLSSLA
ncbi:hypothetical protein NDR87_21045 [Nocardia sp. CDC159]|uniref:Luciferase-like domain-containing protein n=1 Tax=Nocardia pulmonis TaxID=2951408 RepID=A0A9X2E9V4_9NOCA|nr:MULTISPECIES: hypothetical protein [Nocardia]MCM6776434.1 hypothetical protein [Nocardia pulmonis]MCM6788858.1 hypothetical protein [Nocardia sp. CDC159]